MRDLLRRRLRRRDEQHLGLRQQLRERQRHVARCPAADRSAGSRARPSPRPPRTAGPIMDHRTAPHDGACRGRGSGPSTSSSRTVRFVGPDALALVEHLRLPSRCRASWGSRGRRVAVHQADASAGLGVQRDREVDGDGRLADAALAGGHADHVADTARARPPGAGCGPSCCWSPRFSSGVRTSKATLTPVTPSSADTACVTACWKWLRIGQPGRGQRHHHARRRPASPISIERTMPSSTIERRSSGSMTARRLSVTCSVVGILGRASQLVGKPTLASGGQVAVGVGTRTSATDVFGSG